MGNTTTSFSSAPAPPSGSDVKVGTFNLLAHAYTKHCSTQHGGSPSTLESKDQRLWRQNAILQTIEKAGASVWLTQEHDVDFRDWGSTWHVQAATGIKEEGGVSVTRTEGCGIVSRIPPDPASIKTLQLGDGKTAIVADIQGTRFGSFHLSGGPDSDGTKRLQLQEILKAVECPTVERVVIAGDCNCTSPDDTFGDMIAAAGLKRVPYEGFSGMTSRMDKQLQIDHVFVKGFPTVTSASLPCGPATNPFEGSTPSGLGATSLGSDHAPVVVTIPEFRWLVE